MVDSIFKQETKLQKQRERTLKAEERTSKQRVREETYTEKKKEKREKKIDMFVKKYLTKPITVKIILKKQPQLQVRMKDYKQPSILGESNQFFKDEWNETVKSL